jgi:hypothetical protein
MKGCCRKIAYYHVYTPLNFFFIINVLPGIFRVYLLMDDKWYVITFSGFPSLIIQQNH